MFSADWLLDLAKVAGALAGIAGAITVLWRTPPVQLGWRVVRFVARWTVGLWWRKAVAEPAGRWYKRLATETVTPIVQTALQPVYAELKTNGGASLKDAVHRVEENLIMDADLRHERQSEFDSQLGQIKDSLKAGAEWMEKADGKLAQLCPDTIDEDDTSQS